MNDGPTLDNPGPRPGAELDPVEDNPPPRRRRGRRRRLSTLTLRILAPNLAAVCLLVGGVIYLDEYREGLFEAKTEALETEARLISAAISESAFRGPPEKRRIDPIIAGDIIARLAIPTRSRIRLFNHTGILIADSRELTGARRQVQLRYLPPPDAGGWFMRLYNHAYDKVSAILVSDSDYPAYQERWAQHAKDYEEALAALDGGSGGVIRAGPGGTLIITAAVPVQELRQVAGALLLSTDDRDVQEAVREARGAVFQATAAALAITIFLSIFLAGTIERPLRQLAQSAERVRRWRSRRVEIPDLGHRRDEIGDLSVAFRDMTKTLYARLDAIEAFAADVAHEIKNPLTSIRSAVESLPLAKDEAQRDRLLALIQHDISRLNRLISDISNASRVDAELARAPDEKVDLAALLQTAVDIHGQTSDGKAIRYALSLPPRNLPPVDGVSGRLGQVVDNLLANARSFSPDEAAIRLTLYEEDGDAVIAVEDEGPGLQPGEEERVFGRFYSRRPKEEAFGQHSGLGLSICRQIVDAHGGSIRAENRPEGGARFIVRLPLGR